MSTAILIHDSGRPGHGNWVRAQLVAGRAQGAFIDPFHTPTQPRSGQWAAARCVTELLDAIPAAEVLLDPTTHGALLPGTGHWTNYDTWNWWPGGRGRLDTPQRLRDHVEAVLTLQQELGVPTLAPTIALEHPTGPDADLALRLAEEARRQDVTVIQSFVARRSCLAADPHRLDAHVGCLAMLRAPRWVVTAMRDSPEFPPEATDLDAAAGHARSVHSLARRASVTLAHSADSFALPALGAGAGAVGTGWFTKQRISSPGLYGAPGSGGQYILWSPHPGLLARLRSDVAEALADTAPEFARRMRGGRDIPTNEAVYRDQHLTAVRETLDVLDQAGATPTTRVPAVRDLLADADRAWADAVSHGLAELGNRERSRWITGLIAGFDSYAAAEGL